MLRSDMSRPHSKPMATRSGPLRSPHQKTIPTPRVTPQGARPAPAWAYLISEVHPKNWPEFSKTMESGLTTSPSTPALHPGPPQRQDTWSQKVWCRLWNPLSRMPCLVEETARTLETRMKDHLKQKSPRTAVGEHEHPIKMDDVKVIAREDNMWRRKIREFIEIRTRRPVINPPPPPPRSMTNCCNVT